MKILITGATGFVGTELVRRLSGGSHDLHCLVRRRSRVEALEAFGVRFATGDVTDKQSLIEGMRGCDWVVHLANLYEFWHRVRKLYDDVNITGTRNVMEAARQAGVAKVAHVTSVVAYGDAAWPITEATPMGDRVPGDYARTKRAGEQIVREFYEAHRFPVVIIAPGGILGPGDPKASGRYVRDLALGRMPAQVFPRSPFPFVHVRDAAEAIVRALEKDGNEGEKYLVVGENVTFGEVNRMVSEMSGVPMPRLTLPAPIALAGAYIMTGFARVAGKPPALGMSIEQFRMMKRGFVVDNGKSRRELGLSYTPIRTALAEMIASLERDGAKAATG